MKNKKTSKIYDLVRRVNKNKTGIFKREPELIVILAENVASAIGDNKIHISEFIIAKVKGLVRNNSGHPEITDEILHLLPESLMNPFKIYEDYRIPGRNKYIFIKTEPAHQIMVEIFRLESGRTEINTVIPLTIRKRKQLEKNLKAVL